MFNFFLVQGFACPCIAMVFELDRHHANISLRALRLLSCFVAVQPGLDGIEVENLVMQQSDLDRGEMVDKLIKCSWSWLDSCRDGWARVGIGIVRFCSRYDEQRLLAAEQEYFMISIWAWGNDAKLA